MSLVYRLLYLVGFTPWDTGRVPDELTKLVEGDGALAAGRALDIGCGTGTQSVYLAKHGWQVTGVDAVERPLRKARARAATGDAPVQWLLGDVTRLAELGLEPGYGLLFDRGCFHGLNAQQRAAYAAGITALAEPGATMLMMAFAQNNVRVGPGGVDQPEIVQTLAGWELASAAADTGPDPDGPLAKVPRRWYRFTRES